MKTFETVIKSFSKIFASSPEELRAKYVGFNTLVSQISAILDETWGSKKILADDIVTEIFELISSKRTIPTKKRMKKINSSRIQSFKNLDRLLNELNQSNFMRFIAQKKLDNISNLQKSLRKDWDNLIDDSLIRVDLPKGKKLDLAKWDSIELLHDIFSRIISAECSVKLKAIGTATFHLRVGTKSIKATPARIIVNINAVFKTGSSHEQTILRHFKSTNFKF